MKLRRALWFFRHFFMTPFALRMAFVIAGKKNRPFYQIRNLILIIDGFLSYGIYLIVLAALLKLVFFRPSYTPSLNIVLITFLAAVFWLMQVNKREWAQGWLRPFSIGNINIGSARTLRDDVFIGHIFVDNLDYAWDESGVKEVQERVAGATAWFEHQAKNYQVPVRIQNIYLDEIKIHFDNSIPCHANALQFRAEFERLLQPAVMQLKKWVTANKNVKTANYCLFVHALEPIRAYAVSSSVGVEDAGSNIEYCVCTRLDSGAVYAHEILHLFGADDYYAEFYKKLHQYRREFLKDSIMFSPYSLDEVRIDEMTAQKIGWL